MASKGDTNVLKLADEDMEVPELVDNDMSEPEEDGLDGIGWDDDDDIGEGNDDLLLGPVKCLFCDRILNSARETFSHCAHTHTFNIPLFCGRWSLDCIGYIKMINYLRKTQGISPEALQGLSPGSSAPPWEDDGYMMPADPEDLLLQFDMESEDCSAGEVPEMLRCPARSSNSTQSEEEVVMKAGELRALLQRVSDAEAKAAALEEDLERAVSDLSGIRKTAQGLIAGDGPVWGPASQRQDQGGDASDTAVGAIQRLTLKEDDAYFSSYADFNIHAEMLQDKVRSESYRDFIFGNPGVFRDKVVLDIGCGTGILSMFAARAGASHVISVDQSEIIYRAMDIARENGLENKITFLKGRMEDVKLPYEKVDVIISEWMGYFLLFESMLDTVIVARGQHLAPGGCVYPDKCSMWLAGFTDDKLLEKVLDFWDDVYGFKMSCMKTEVLSQTAVDIIDSDKMITHPASIKEIDVNTCSLTDVDFSSPFSLKCSKAGFLHGLIGYFDIGFEAGCSTKVHFSTGPASPSTHWKQVQFLLATPIPLSKGQTVEGNIEVKKNRKDPRSLDIRITLNGKSQDYYMD